MTKRAFGRSNGGTVTHSLTWNGRFGWSVDCNQCTSYITAFRLPFSETKYCDHCRAMTATPQGAKLEWEHGQLYLVVEDEDLFDQKYLHDPDVYPDRGMKP